MSTQQPVMTYTQGFGSHPQNVEIPIVTNVAPNSTQSNFPIGKRWINTLTNSEYILTNLATSAGVTTATWTLLESGSSSFLSLTGDTGTALPAAGSVKLAGTTHQITTAASGSTVTFTIPSTFVAPGTIESTGLLTGDAGLTVSGGAVSVVSGTAAFGLSTDAAATTVSIANGAAVKAVTLGSTNTTSGVTINTGASGTTSIVGSGGTVNIANDATATNVNLGSTSSGTVAIAAGTAINVVGANASTITLGAAAQTGKISIADSTGAMPAIDLMNGVAAGAQVLNIASGTSATAAQTVNILNGTTPGANTTLSIMNGAASAGTQAVSILSTGATRAGTVSIGNGAAAHTCIFGSTNTTAATTINAGTGGLLLTGGQVVPVTNVTNGMTPYSLLGTDQFVAVNPTAGVVQVTLPSSPVTGRYITVYDATGQAGAHTITISGNGNNISAAGTSGATATITAAYGSIELWFNGTIWNGRKST